MPGSFRAPRGEEPLDLTFTDTDLPGAEANDVDFPSRDSAPDSLRATVKSYCQLFDAEERIGKSVEIGPEHSSTSARFKGRERYLHFTLMAPFAPLPGRCHGQTAGCIPVR